MEAYLDNSATTKCAREVVETVVKVMQDDYGNPSSKHMKGVRTVYQTGRRHDCQKPEMSGKRIGFYVRRTESNNMAIIGTAMANKRRGITLSYQA